MKLYYYFILLILTLYPIDSISQFCTQNDRFTELNIFTTDEISSITNVTYATDVENWNGEIEDLEIDFFFPSESVDSLTSRPFILLLHGGGFQSGNKFLMTNYCIGLAQKGYVAATMNYRLGWDNSIPTEQVKAGYRVQQDVNAAFRFIVDQAETNNIDTSWLFIGGQSAGAIASFLSVYTKEEDWENYFPDITTELGSLHTSGNNLTHTFDIKGIFNNWGMSFESSFLPSSMVPTISFHGELDNIVPIDSSSIGIMDFIGSRAIHNNMLMNNICSELMIDPNSAHGILTNEEGLQLRLGRASCFFKSVFCNDCNSELFMDDVPADCSTITTYVSDISEKNLLEFYPNPSQNYLTTKGDLNSYKIEVMNNVGRPLQNINITENSKIIDISEVKSGLYFLRTTHLKTNQVNIQKIIKL